MQSKHWLGCLPPFSTPPVLSGSAEPYKCFLPNHPVDLCSHFTLFPLQQITDRNKQRRVVFWQLLIVGCGLQAFLLRNILLYRYISPNRLLTLIIIFRFGQWRLHSKIMAANFLPNFIFTKARPLVANNKRMEVHILCQVNYTWLQASVMVIGVIF